MLKPCNILLGVTGSIAAYKSVDIARRLQEEGAAVSVVMTDAATRFITPYIFEAVTGKPVPVDMFKDPFSHINLALDAGLFLIAPVTANTINKFASGIADNLLTNLWLTFKGKVIMAPAMNTRMYQSPIVLENIQKLRDAGVHFVGPETGSLACGEEGLGRMSEVSDIVESVVRAMTPDDMKGEHVLITAGPTAEPIDPIRYITNRSSGKMGYAVAEAALRRGAKVTLVSGPTSLQPPSGAEFIKVRRAEEMERAVMESLPSATIVVMAAAVSDFSPVNTALKKMDKSELSEIKLRQNNDIIRQVGADKGTRILVGFAAETGNSMDRAIRKRREKNLDLVVMNDVTTEGAGFEVDTNIVSVIDAEDRITEYPIMKKIEVADIILDRVSALKG